MVSPQSKSLKVLFLFLLVGTVFFGNTVIFTPPKELLTLKTKYFEYIYEEELYFYVQDIMESADSVYEDYASFYGVRPEGIKVYMLDDVDYVNAFAVGFDNKIRMYVNTADFSSGLLSSNFLSNRMIFCHELNHLFYSNMVNNPFISWIPNQTIKKISNMTSQPSYLHEGLSIYMESKYFGGRFENDLFNMYLKAEVLSPKYPRYELGSGAQVKVWSPAGFNYMYGALFTKEIAGFYSEEVLREIVRLTSSSFFSSISGAFEKVTGDKWSEFLQKIKLKYIEQMSINDKSGKVQKYEKLGKEYERTGNLRTDGKNLYAYKVMPFSRAGVYKNEELIIPEVSKFDVSPNGEVIFSKTISNDGNAFNNLYIKCDCPISDTLIAQRVLNFGFADSRTVVYTANDKGLSGVFVYDLLEKTAVQILGWDKYVMNSVCGTQEDIYLSLTYNGQSDIYRYDRKNETMQRLTDDKSYEADLSYAKGKLFYTKNYNGIFNIFSLDPQDMTVRQITFSEMGAFSPAVLGDKLYFLSYDWEGYYISQTDLNLSRGEEKLSPQAFIFESTGFIGENNISGEKYFEKPQHIIVYPYVELSEDILEMNLSELSLNYGMGVIVISDAYNYMMDYSLVFKKDALKHNLEMYFNTLAAVDVKLVYEKNLHSALEVSKDFSFYLKDMYFLKLAAAGSANGITPEKVSLQAQLFQNPYSINKISLYDVALSGYYLYDNTKNSHYFSVGIFKPVYLYNFRLTPFFEYDSLGNTLAGATLYGDLYYPYWNMFDGKRGLNGFSVESTLNYNFKDRKMSCSVYFILDLKTSYWANYSYKVPVFKMPLSN